MSYARSPRPLCSMTMGMRPSPRGSSALISLIVNSALLKLGRRYRSALRRLRLHQSQERRRLILDRGPLQNPIDDVAFDRAHLVFVQAGRILVVPPDHCLGLLEALRR